MNSKKSSQSIGSGGFFRYHGPLAPGVRLFRRINFQAKALLVSVAFLVPIALLLWAYLQNSEANVEVARQERVGLQIIKQVDPWLIAAQRQRRLVLSGTAAKPDMADIDASLAAVTAIVAATPDGVDATASFEVASTARDALVAATRKATGIALEEPLQAYVDAVRAFRNDVLDASQLSLDPEQTTYYLMMASTSQVSDAIEGVSRSRGLAAAVAANGTKPRDLARLHDVWHDGQQAVDAMKDAIARADAATPGLAKEIPLDAATAAAGTFFEASDEISSASTDLSHRSEQAAASLEESASAMEQISTTVLQAADATRTVSRPATDNASVAGEGGRTISQVLLSMRGAGVLGADLRDHRRDRRDCLPDQHPRVERGRRSGARGRARARVRRRRQRGARAGPAVVERGARDQDADYRQRRTRRCRHPRRRGDGAAQPGRGAGQPRRALSLAGGRHVRLISNASVRTDMLNVVTAPDDEPDRIAFDLARVIDLSPTAVSYWGADLKCVYANRACQHWLGVDPEILVGCELASVFEVLGLQAHFELVEAALQGRCRSMVQSFREGLGKRDGLVQYVPDVRGAAVKGVLFQVGALPLPIRLARTRN